MLADPAKPLLDPDKHPYFCKLLFREGFMDKILMLPVFINEHKKMLAKTCLLKTGVQMLWEAKIVRERSNFFICEGDWSQFVVYHKLELGDILLFFLIGRSTFQVLPYTQKCYRNLRGRQLFEELSSSSEEEADIGPSRKSNKVKMEPKEPSNPEEESVDPSSGSKDGENPWYSHSGGKSDAEADNMLSVKKRAKGQSRLIKYVKDPDKLKRPASVSSVKLERRLASAFVKREWRPASAFSVKRKRRPASLVKRAQSLANDPDKPKRPASAFVLFMEELKQFMKEKPKAKWKQLSDVDRAPYITEAEKTKAEYQKNMGLYNRRVAAGSMEEEEYHKYWSKVDEEEEDDD